MVIEDKLQSYLNGEKFTNGLVIEFGDFENYGKKRLDALDKLCENKNVIHFGCADHVPLIEQKIEHNSYLHKRFEKSTKKVVGLDFDLEAIEFMKSLKFDDVYHFNVFEDDIPTEISDTKFDYIIVGEVLEHTDNPVSFIKTIKEKFAPICKSIVITVPNLASTSRFNDIKKNREFINTDHRYWFTPFTLAKVITVADLEIEKITGTDVKPANYLEKRLLKAGLKKPKMNNCDTLIGIANLN